ncbi:hypothetical protein ACFFX0_15830 [Citricoccus parietis]|uniref:Uncharacterized protein n=1 Tax=Citricoccus parietis TaxID=592307 RepID=A0ABV5G0X8_9MICC
MTTMTIARSEPRKNEATTIPSSRCGTAFRASTPRRHQRPTPPPITAHEAPTTVPMTTAPAAPARAASRDTRSPAADRRNRSRPATSVPNGCAAEGPWAPV